MQRSKPKSRSVRRTTSSVRRDGSKAAPTSSSLATLTFSSSHSMSTKSTSSTSPSTRQTASRRVVAQTPSISHSGADLGSRTFKSSHIAHARTPADFDTMFENSQGNQLAKIRRIKQERALEELLRDNHNDDDIYASSSSTEWTTDVEGKKVDYDHREARVHAKKREKITPEKVKKYDEERVKRGPSPVQLEHAQDIVDTLDKRLTIDDQPQEEFDFLDPLNPPNLNYEHVKLLKNIDYSPLIRRAKEGGMFTVEDVISILQTEGVTSKFKSGMRREHMQDPFVFEETFDLFNRGKKPCPLCLPDPTPNKENRIHYTNVNLLRKYISTTGLILPRRVSGVCAKHQNKLRFAIKNAKQLALLSFTSNWHVPLSYVYPDKYPSYEDQDAAANVERLRRREIKDLYDNLREDKTEMILKRSADNALLKESAELGDVIDGPKESSHRTLEEIIKARITDDMGESEIERIHIEEERRYELRRDMGDLVDLDKFDLDMSFDQFVARYNATITAKHVQTLDHDQLFIADSDNEEDSLIEAYAPLDTNARTRERREAEEAYRRKEKED